MHGFPIAAVMHESLHNKNCINHGTGERVADNELDVRQLRKPDKTRAPAHAEFDGNHPGGYGWDYLDKGPELWRIRISRLTSTPLVVC